MKMDETDKTPNWLHWAQRLQAIAQTGLTYNKNPFDRQRLEEVNLIAAEILAAQTGEVLKNILDPFDLQSGYATPKVDVRGVLFRDRKLLLVRELRDEGRWTLPGGWADVGDSPSDAVEREMREEAGVVVKASKLLAVYDRNLHGFPPDLFHTYKLFIQCEFLGECKADELETSSPTYFGIDEIPELSRARVTEKVIRRMFDFLENPSLPTDFD
jgi:ADP-ribose pyrophosphatase YjhB (NUDIX family)